MLLPCEGIVVVFCN